MKEKANQGEWTMSTGRRLVGLTAWPRRLAVAACVAFAIFGSAVQATTLLHYNFSNGSGSTVTDLSANGRDGTLGGFTNTDANAGVFGVSEGWVSGGGLSFLDDNVDCSYVDTPLAHNALINNGGSFTIEFTASANTKNGWAPAIGKVPSFGPDVYIGPSGYPDATNLLVSFGDWESETTANPWSRPGDGSDPASRHIAVVFTKNGGGDGGTFEVFVDGTSKGTWPCSFNLNVWDKKFCIGNSTLGTTRDTGKQWDGVIYGVAFSDQALTPSTFVLKSSTIALSPSSLAENQPAGTTVGALSTVGDTGPFTYTLVSGVGDTDNASFQIDGSTLKSAARFDFETKSSYSIRVRSTGGASITNVFTISVTNVVEDYMMLVGAEIVPDSREVGTVRTSGDYATTDYVISGGTDAGKFEWASAGVLRLKDAASSGDLGKKYYVEITTTNTQSNTAKVMIEATVVRTRTSGTVILIR